MDYNPQALKDMQATAERYHRGVTQEVVSYLEGRGIPRGVQDEFLLGTCDDIHDGWLSIPYLRGSNGVIHFNYRNMQEGAKPKYASPGKKHLYNTADMDLADQTGEICICEGELDTIVLSALWGIPAVGVPGATQWSGNPHWHHLFSGYQTVWIMADPDEAGMGMATAILETLTNARLVKLPADVNDCHLNGFDLRGAMQ